MSGEAAPDARERAMSAAARALARRARSTAELRARLSRIAPADVCEAVVEDLMRLGYVDDRALACALAERRLEQGWGAGRVEADLIALAVPASAAAEALALARDGEREAAARQLRRTRCTRPREAWRRLVRRGFADELAGELAEQLAAQVDADSAPLDAG